MERKFDLFISVYTVLSCQMLHFIFIFPLNYKIFIKKYFITSSMKRSAKKFINSGFRLMLNNLAQPRKALERNYILKEKKDLLKLT